MNTWRNSKDVSFLFLVLTSSSFTTMAWGIDIMDLKTAACRLGRKSKYRFYLRMFFDLIDVTHVYMKLGDTYLYRNSKLSLQIL